MLKILKDITEKINNSNAEITEIKVGNYSAKKSDLIIIHKYYGNTICLVSLQNLTFKLFDCGYSGYRLTTAQLNYLKKYYSEKGYEQDY